LLLRRKAASHRIRPVRPIEPGGLCYSVPMATVTIPREMAERRDLVAVPRREYEQFIEWQRRVKSAKTFAPTAAQKRALASARKRRRQGEYLTFHELRRALDSDR